MYGAGSRNHFVPRITSQLSLSKEEELYVRELPLLYIGGTHFYRVWLPCFLIHNFAEALKSP